MPSMTFTEKLGFLRSVVEFMDKNQAALQAAGFDATKRLAATFPPFSCQGQLGFLRC